MRGQTMRSSGRMPSSFTRRDRPPPWREERQRIAARWAVPFFCFNWVLKWVSWALSHWALLDVLDHVGRFSVLIAVVFYFADSGNRTKQKHYQAWQVIDTAQGKGGSGGRIEAMQELNADHVSLTGVDASGAFLRGVHLENAHLERCDLHDADLRGSDFRSSRLPESNLRSANFRQANLGGVDFHSAEMEDADLNQADLEKADLTGVDLSRVDLRFADGKDFVWKDIQSMELANIYGMKNVPDEFVALAKSKGAVSLQSDDDWNALLRKAASDAK